MINRFCIASRSVATKSAAVVLAAVLSACSSMPERVATLEEAQSRVQSLEQDPLTQQAAPDQFARAQTALRRAEQIYEEREPLEDVEYEAYVALRNAQIAEQMIAQQRAREELQQGEAERTRVLLQAREQEAQSAQAAAAEAEALALEREAEAEQQSAQARRAQRQAQQAESRSRELEEEVAGLEEELAGLKAEQTDRGLVVTLSDVLFDVDEAALKPGAQTALDRIARFMSEQEDRRILIEGHTDSTGSEQYNRNLAEERAAAVRDALVDRGIDAERVETRGLGEAYPVASNATAAGRQLNRRVEIVFSGNDGRFGSGAQRSASRG